MSNFTLSSNINALSRKLKSYPEVTFRHLRPAFAKASADFLARHKRERLSGRPGLNRVTGTLARSFTFSVSGGNLETLKATIFTTSKYSRIHEFGGVIRAKNAKYLTFKIGKGKGASWVSKKQVKIPKRLEFYRTWRSPKNAAAIKGHMVRALREALREVSSG